MASSRILPIVLLAAFSTCSCKPRECICVYESCRDAGQVGNLDPGTLNQLYEQAAIELQMAGEYRASLVFIDRILNTAPGFPDIYFLRGYAFQMIDNNGEAIISYQRQLERNANHRQTLFNLAYAQMTVGDYPSAIENFNRTLEVDPTYNEVNLHLATCYDAVGQHDLAEQYRQLYTP